MLTTMDGVPKVTLALETTVDMVLYMSGVMLAGMVVVPIVSELVEDSDFE
jgi:hypothetical protein